MKGKIFSYAIGIWLIFVAFAILNGAFRNLVLEPKIGKYAGHVISTILLISVILMVTFLFIRKIMDYSKIDLVLIGTTWVLLTIIFEFIFGHYVMGNSWNTLLADYNIFKGRLWSLVLITEFVSPLRFGSIKSGCEYRNRI